MSETLGQPEPLLLVQFQAIASIVQHKGIAVGNIRKEKEGRRVVTLALNRGN